MLVFLLSFLLQSPTNVPDRVQSGRILLEQGTVGLAQLLESAGAPPLTFDQETQIRGLHAVFSRELDCAIVPARAE
jgi:hypothetical protein